MIVTPLPHQLVLGEEDMHEHPVAVLVLPDRTKAWHSPHRRYVAPVAFALLADAPGHFPGALGLSPGALQRGHCA